MYLNIILLPLLSFIFSSFGGLYLGTSGACFFTVYCIGLTVFSALIVLYENILLQSTCYIDLFSWIDIECLNIGWGFLFDTITSSMLFIITIISFLVHLYSIEYMGEDPHLIRFMGYLSLFTFFMIILVTANNLLQMFIGWEGVGLCSYLLINF